jgi:hypothetical protein
VSRILAEDETTNSGVKIPAQSTFWLWLYQDDEKNGGTGELSEKLAEARARGVEALIDECGEIADDAVNDYLEKVDQKTENRWWEFQKEHVQRSKLRIETRLKMAAMLQPRKYGAKLDLTSGGEKLGRAAELEAARRRVMKGDDDEG